MASLPWTWKCRSGTLCARTPMAESRTGLLRHQKTLQEPAEAGGGGGLGSANQCAGASACAREGKGDVGQGGWYYLGLFRDLLKKSKPSFDVAVAHMGKP